MYNAKETSKNSKSLQTFQFSSGLYALRAIPYALKIVPPRFELGSKDPKSSMIVHYTTGLKL